MGVVWEAVHEVTARRVAMKLIVNATDNLRMRLLREARAAGKIAHRNVVEVYDIGETEEQDPFLVMQLLVGETLYAAFKREGALEPKRGLAFLRDIARALVAAHTQGIIHRDLKPANVFLHREAGSEGEIVKVLDFGLCKPMGDNEMLTTPGGMLGSPAYMAPEQIIAVADIDPRTDIWALGILAFEMFSGKRPFQGRGPDLIHAVVKDPIPRLRDVVPSIDPDLDEVVAGCIVRDRNQRFARAADVVSRLEVLVDRAERAEPREPMPSDDDDGDLGVTQVYRAGTPIVRTPSAAGKTIPMMSTAGLNLPQRPVPPSNEAGPPSGQPQSQAQPPAAGWPSNTPVPQTNPPKPQTFGGPGLHGTALMPSMPDAPYAQWQAPQQAQPQQIQGGFPVGTGQTNAVALPFAPAERQPPRPLQPWIAVVVGVGIGLFALLAIIIAIGLSRQSSPDPGPAPVKSAGG